MDDRYEVRCKIGESALGTVYRGLDRRTRRDVAIKRVVSCPTGWTAGGDVVGRLSRLIASQSAVDHPNILKVLEVGSDGGDAVLIMDLAAGESLDHRLERSPLGATEFRDLVVQTLHGLDAAHQAGMIHGDLKPSNLMIEGLDTGGVSIRILDFGIAEMVCHFPGSDPGMIEAPLDSIFCMAPERFERRPPSIAGDLYSAGCVFYLSLTTRHPFDGRHGNEIVEAHLRHHLEPLAELRPDLPAWLCDWVLWLLNRYPEHRPASAAEALDVFLVNEAASLVRVQPVSATI